MAGYVGNVPVPQSVREDQSFTATAGQTTFNTLGYTDGNRIKVTLNGVLLEGGGVDYTATNGSDVVLTVAAVIDDIVRFETFNEVQLVNSVTTNPTFKTSATLLNETEEDIEGGRESTLIFQGEQSGGELTTLAEIEASHDGTADDEKGDLIFRTNDGNDGTSPTERLRINSGGDMLFSSEDPSLTLANTTHEDSDGGRESTIAFQGEQSGGEISLLAQIEAAHDGTADDEKGDLIFRTNDGADGSAPTERLRIDSGGRFGFAATPSTSSTVKIQNINDTTHNTLDLFNDNGNRNFTFQQDTTGNAKLILQKNDGTNAVRLDANLGGILFGTDTAAANTLDDYEEGTFNLTMTGANGNPSTTQNLASQYTKIGSFVYFRSFGTLNNSGAAGPISFTGLPFSPTGVTIASIECNHQGTFSLSPYGYVSGTVIYIQQMRSQNSYLTVSHNTHTSGEWSITGHYMTNS